MVSIVNHRITWRSSLSFIGCLILFSVFFRFVTTGCCRAVFFRMSTG